jgi:hypothetical protein
MRQRRHRVLGGRNVDELTGGFAAEWAEEEGV